ncbi:hypothetical protein KY366_00020, partial [Candidatus Woesearchaeota archaeon]|nr:hypothetical protein [Candidatus Woesearchaeota archaeon]
MKKGVIVLLFLILFSLTSLVSAGVIDQKINSIVHYAEQYELGKIDYLQLIVYGNTIREEINSQLGQEYRVEGDWVHRGFSEEDVKKLFGQPTEMTSWVWVVNEEHDEYVDEKLPKWEKRLFDGRKIMITFNAWPQIIKKQDGIIRFYEVDFHIRFKTHYQFDLDGMLSEIKSKAEQYVENKQNGRNLAEKIVEYGEFLWGYLEQNNDDCKDIMKEFFSSEHKQEQQKKVRLTVDAYEGKNLILRINVEACESCEWPHVNMWFDIDTMGRFKRDGLNALKGQDKHELSEEQTIEELQAELEDTIEGLIGLVEESDKAGEFRNPERISSSRAALEKINMLLDEKYYGDVRDKSEGYEKRLSFLTGLLGRYGQVQKEAFTEIRYENRLVEEFEEISNKHCRQAEFECGLDEGCLDGECIDAKGGLEDCHNMIDDDGDGIADCPDPDCAAECGWICKDQCQEECWSCHERECSSECQECWRCNDNGGKNCDDLCRDTCWKCQEEKCESKPFCKPCKKCQEDARDEYEEQKCNMLCAEDEDSQDCENCQNNLKQRQCRDVCEDSCWQCKRENCHETGECKDCWECDWDKDGKKCESRCEGCWECENKNCNEKEVCSECR